VTTNNTILDDNKEIAELYDATFVLNDAIGSLHSKSQAAIQGQLARIREELEETEWAFEKGCNLELLDGAIDVLVTAMGLVQILESQGFDVYEACSRVADNNLKKFIPVEEAEKSVEVYKKQGIDCYVKKISKFSDDFSCIIRTSDGKLLKPIGHPKVDLSDLVCGCGYKSIVED
jgi:hypothetical protein